MDTNGHINELLFAGGQQLQSTLAGVRGLSMTDGHRGSLRVGRQTLQVRLESEDLLSLLLQIETPPAARAAIEAHQPAGSNLRFVRSGYETALRADSLVDGQAHIPHTIKEIGRDACRVAKGSKPPARETSAPAAEDVQAALDRLGWPEDAVTTLEEGWELRCRLGKDDLSVQLRQDEDGVRMYRSIVPLPPEDDRAEVVADQALRFNAQLRMARLAVVGDRLVAESRLRGELVTAKWLDVAARAVAAAAQHAEPVLRLLAEDPSAVAYYAACFAIKTQ